MRLRSLTLIAGALLAANAMAGGPAQQAAADLAARVKSIDQDVASLKSQLADLKSELATLRANCKCNAASSATLSVAGNPITVTVDPPGKFNVAKAAMNVATLPVRVAANACAGGNCQSTGELRSSAELSPITVYSPPLSVGWGGQVYQGGCSGGSCGVQRAGLFGRRR